MGGRHISGRGGGVADVVSRCPVNGGAPMPATNSAPRPPPGILGRLLDGRRHPRRHLDGRAHPCRGVTPRAIFVTAYTPSVILHAKVSSSSGTPSTSATEWASSTAAVMFMPVVTV